jgi:nitrogenase molybdenum-iron protein alpha/beta subunit
MMNTVRRQAKLNQVVCMLEGMLGMFQQTAGDFVVVIHSEPDCANVISHSVDTPFTERFYCTNLDENDLILGKSISKLEECLLAVSRQIQPQVIFVLGSCLSSLIGEQPEAMIETVQKKTKIPIAMLPGTGMRFISQADIVDQFSSLMIKRFSAPKREMPNQNLINFLGFMPDDRVSQQLAKLGIDINSVIGLTSNYSDWQVIPQARYNVVLDKDLYQKTLALTGKQFGQETVEVPLPIGYRATKTFFDRLISLFADIDTSLLEDDEQRARQAIERAAERFDGICLGYNIGSIKNLDPMTLANEGLGELSLFSELGMKIVVLVQGDDSPKRLAAVKKYIENFPVAVFSDTVFFHQVCRQHDCQLVYASDHLKSEAQKAGVGFIPLKSLEYSYHGVKGNIDKIQAALDDRGSQR